MEGANQKGTFHLRGTKVQEPLSVLDDPRTNRTYLKICSARKGSRKSPEASATSFSFSLSPARHTKPDRYTPSLQRIIFHGDTKQTDRSTTTCLRTSPLKRLSLLSERRGPFFEGTNKTDQPGDRSRCFICFVRETARNFRNNRSFSLLPPAQRTRSDAEGVYRNHASVWKMAPEEEHAFYREPAFSLLSHTRNVRPNCLKGDFGRIVPLCIWTAEMSIYASGGPFPCRIKDFDIPLPKATIYQKLHFVHLNHSR